MVDPVVTRRLSRANEDYLLYAERPVRDGNAWTTTVGLSQGEEEHWSHDVSGYDSTVPAAGAIIR